MDKIHKNLRACGTIHGNQIRELYSRPWQEQTAQKLVLLPYSSLAHGAGKTLIACEQTELAIR